MGVDFDREVKEASGLEGSDEEEEKGEDVVVRRRGLGRVKGGRMIINEWVTESVEAGHRRRRR